LVARSNEKKLAYKLKGKSMKINQLGILVSVFGIVGFTTSSNFTNVRADLPAPSTFTYSYKQSNVHPLTGNSWALLTTGNPSAAIEPIYSGTYDGQYYTYTNTIQIISGLNVTQTFNRSNTSWTTITSGNPFTARPSNSTANIGSNNQVGSIESKVSLTFNNQTNRDYVAYIDLSSTPVYNSVYRYRYEPLLLSAPIIDLYFTGRFFVMMVPSYTTWTFMNLSTSNQQFFDAWYLQDIGLNDAFNQGYDTGYFEGDSQGYLDGFEFGYESGFDDGLDELNSSTTGLFDILGNVFGAVSVIFGIYILPGVNIGMLVFIPLIFTLLLFILKILRGGS